jgi:hypothetical protein
MQDLSHIENVSQRAKSVGSLLPLADGCSRSGVCWDRSSYTNVVLGGINIGSHAVLPFRQCRVLAARTRVRSAPIASGSIDSKAITLGFHHGGEGWTCIVMGSGTRVAGRNRQTVVDMTLWCLR